MPHSANRFSARRAAFGAFLLIFITCGYFQNSRPGWAVNSSFSLTCAIVEKGTLRIDDYHQRKETETGDKSFYQGHFYCDKSPIVSFLGTVPFAVYRGLAKVSGSPFSYAAGRYWATWWTSGLSAAILAALLTLLLARRGVLPVRAARAAALWVAATPLLGYGILFTNSLPSCALALGGFFLVDAAWRDPARNRLWRMLGGGLLLGLAAWALNLQAIPALAITMLLLLSLPALAVKQIRPHAWINRLVFLLPWMLGGVLGAAGYFIYSYCLFGSFASPYKFESDSFMREQMARGLMGATWPRPIVAWLITFHPYQGLFVWFPLALLALLGMIRLLRGGERSMRREAWAALAIFLVLLVYNSAYYMWWGGWSYAPRHLIPALPLFALGLLPWLKSRFKLIIQALFFIGLVGAILNIAAVALDPQVPPTVSQAALMQPQNINQWPSPFLLLQKYFWLKGAADHNWGAALGLKRQWQLAPLAAIWLTAWWLIGLIGRKRPISEIERA